MAVAIEGATERVGFRAHHRRDIDVGIQLHQFACIGLCAVVHCRCKTIPISCIADDDSGMHPLHKVGASCLDAQRFLEVQCQRTIGQVRCRAVQFHDGDTD